MRLRARMFLVVGLVVVGLLVLVFAIVSGLLMNQFDGLEERAAAVDSARVRSAVGDAISDLERASRDLAARDSTFDFMRGARPDPPSALRSDESLANLGVNAVLLLSEDGDLRFARFIDLDLQTSDTTDTAVVDALVDAGALRKPGDPRGHVSGLIRVDSRVLMVSARSVTTADMYSSPKGTLVLARFIDGTQVETLEGETRLALDAFPLSGTSVPSDVRLAAANLDEPDDRWTEPLPNGTLGSYTLFKDVGGEPALILRGSLPREIHAQGLSAVASLAVSLFVIGAAAAVSLFIVIDHGALTRMSKLSREVAEITESTDLTRRVTAEGKDEIASLAEDVNGMLGAIEESEEKLLRARDRLEERVHERTTDLRKSESRYRNLVERMVDAVFTVGDDGIITFANEQAGELTGRSQLELVGMPFSQLLSPSSDEDIDLRFREAGERRAPLALEATISHPTEGAVPVEVRASPAGRDAGSGTQAIVHDIAKRKRYEAELIHLASHDHLTGLYNRRYFEEALERELAQARRAQTRGAVLWLDVDDFKDVNDSLGHHAGDDVLVELGEQLRQQVRDYSVLARLGGDEFGVLVPDVAPEEAQLVADRVLSAVNSRTYDAGGHAIRVSASMGVVLFPMHGTTAEELLAKADVSMYAAKAAGRSRFHVHETDMGTDEELSARVHWNERLVEALRDGTFQVYEQPLLDLRTDTIARHELLIRMVDDSGRIVQPSEFLPTAERLGLIRDIDRWMVRRAVELLAERRDENLELDVNLSGKVFSDTGILAAVADALREADVDPARLGFEITETAAVADILRAQEFICTLSDIGCRFSLDDFGSGFSSFYYLRHLPIDCLKIDGSFIRGLPQSEQDRHLVKGMVELCRGLGVEVAAEYVENKETLKVVRELGIDYAQGYEIGRPTHIELGTPLLDRSRPKDEPPIVERRKRGAE